MNIISFIKNIFKINKKKVHPINDNSEKNQKIILNWVGKPIDYYHWWPMKQTKQNNDDIYNNLYANGGGLSKYDNLFSTKIIE